MYQMRYEDVLEESTASARERESVLFERCIGLLQAAEKAGPATEEAAEAVRFTRRLWIALIEDLGLSENSLPKETRASLISVGFFVLREMEQLEGGSMIDFAAVIDVSQAIRAGLAA